MTRSRNLSPLFLPYPVANVRSLLKGDEGVFTAAFDRSASMFDALCYVD